MHSNPFIKFISLNWNLYNDHELSDPLLLFFILKNLYCKILPNLNEFSVVDSLTFESVVYSNNENLNGNDNSSYTFSVLLSKINLLLSEGQKDLIEILLSLESKRNSNNYLELFNIFYSNQDGRSYLLVSESSLYNIINIFSSILENDKSKCLSNKIEVNEKITKYIKLAKDKGFTNEINLFDKETLGSAGYKTIIISICFLLLHINPSFSGVSKRIYNLLTKCGRKNLFKCSLIVNNLINFHPKESDLWDIKSTIIRLWFNKFKFRISRFKVVPDRYFLKRYATSNIFNKYLMKTIHMLFTDRLVLLDKSFIEYSLFIKPFNNCVITYLRHQYDCVINSVIPFFLSKIKSLDNLLFFNKFRDFNYMDVVTRYLLTLSNAICKLFYDFYTRLLRNFGFPGLFILFVNLVKDRSYNRLPTTIINYEDLYSSCFLYTRMETYFEDSLMLCDKMIRKDSENTWIDNKSKLLFQLLDLANFLRPFYFDKELVDLIFKFRVVLILNQYFSTWSSLGNLYFILFDSTVSNAIFKIRKKNDRCKRLKFKLDEHKSESVLIRKFIYEGFEYEQSGFLDGYGFANVRYIYLDSLTICQALNDLQIDQFLNLFNQLLYILLHLFRNIYKLNKSTHFNLDLSDFKLLFETIFLVYKYSRLINKLGSKVNVLVGLNFIKKINCQYKSIFYKYHKLLHTEEHVPYYLNVTVAKLALLLVSPLFRFYLHWVVSSQLKFELLYKQVLKLK